MKSRSTSGYAGLPIIFHHWRIEATANSGVSWSRPTLTQASLRAMSYTLGKLQTPSRKGRLFFFEFVN